MRHRSTLGAWLALIIVPWLAIAQQGGERRLPNRAYLEQAKITLRWTSQVPVLSPQEYVTAMTLHEGVRVTAPAPSDDDSNAPEAKVLGKPKPKVDAESADEAPSAKTDADAPSAKPTSLADVATSDREGLIFLSTNRGMLYCLDDNTGKLNWAVKVGVQNSEVFPPAVVDQYIYATAGDSLMRIHRATGHILETRSLGTLATSGPAANKEFVYLQLSGRRFLCLTFNPDRVDYPFGKRDYVLTLWPTNWGYIADGEMENRPILLENMVVFVSDRGTVYSSRPASRNLVYRYFTFAPMSAPISTLETMLYCASSDFTLHALKLETGATRWRYISGYPINHKPVPFLNSVYITPEGNGLHCLDNQNGKPQWTNPSVTRFINASQKKVYGLDKDGNMLVVARSTGETLFSVPIPGFNVVPENQYNDRSYLATKDGLILCMHETDNVKPFLHPQRAPEAEKDDDNLRAARKPQGARDFFSGEGESKAKPKPKPKSKKGEDEDEEDKKDKKKKTPKKTTKKTK